MQIEAARGIILMILSARVCVYALLDHHLPVSGALTTNSDENVPISFVMPACLSLCLSLWKLQNKFLWNLMMRNSTEAC